MDITAWNDFVKWCREHKTSTCFEIRSYIDARLGGEAVVTSRHPLTVHQTVIYQVERPRRKAHLPETEEKVTMQYLGGVNRCAHCKAKPVFLGHVWVSNSLCHALYLCSPHHDFYNKKQDIRYSFKPL